jgi:hypothetical protein
MIDDKTADAPGNCIGVMIRTPAGASSAFATRPVEKAETLIQRAVAYFVGKQLLEPGTFKLALARDGRITDFGPEEHLRDHDVVEGDVLHLITCEPQVDGARGL